MIDVNKYLEWKADSKNGILEKLLNKSKKINNQRTWWGITSSSVVALGVLVFGNYLSQGGDKSEASVPSQVSKVYQGQILDTRKTFEEEYEKVMKKFESNYPDISIDQ
ncbi:MAG: hypothetical protein ABH811_02965 [archaeon]